jgi:CubicO group peptidase (beta-lactamase class C family)
MATSRRLRHLSSALAPPAAPEPAAAGGLLGRLKDSLLLGGRNSSKPQQPELYQPSAGDDWAAVAPEVAAGWDAEKLGAAFEFAGKASSTGLLISLNGRILREEYWAGSLILGGRSDGSETVRKPEDVTDLASAQKGLIAVLFGIAQDKGLLALSDPVSKHIPGWTHASAEEEDEITIEHLLTMSTGLDAEEGQPEGPGGGGMHVSVPAGSIWKYNTVAYQTGCHCTLAAAAGSSVQELTREWVLEPIGCSAAASEWRPRVEHTEPPNNGDSTMMPHTVGFFSSPRDMIRLGLLLLGDGRWNGEAVVSTAWLDALSSSCETNAAYGYLWWLNGKSSVSSPGRAGPGKLS